MMNPYPFLPLADDATQPTSYEFASAAESAALLAAGTVAVPLLQWRLIRVSGDDRVDFLHNLMSNDVKKLAAGALQWNSLNSAKGRMIASILLWKDNESVMLALSADLHAQVKKKLSMYVLRSKTRIEDASEDFALIGVTGDGAADVLATAGLEQPTTPMSVAPALSPRTLQINPRMFIVLAAADEASARWQALLAAGARAAGTGAWDLMQIRAGLPRVTQPVQEEFVAQMLNYELIGGVSFNKGCYPGQEIVARTQYLGKLKKRTYRLRFGTGTEASVGQDLFSADFGEQSAGKIVMAAAAPEGGIECLAVLQSSSADGGEIRLGAPNGPTAELLPLPYSLA